MPVHIVEEAWGTTTPLVAMFRADGGGPQHELVGYKDLRALVGSAEAGVRRVLHRQRPCSECELPASHTMPFMVVPSGGGQTVTERRPYFRLFHCHLCLSDYLHQAADTSMRHTGLSVSVFLINEDFQAFLHQTRSGFWS